MYYKIPFLRPPFGYKEKLAVCNVMSGNNISVGPETIYFEEDLGNYLQSKTLPLTVCNGTIALELIWQTFIERGKLKRGDKVLCPSFTFVAVANSIVRSGLEPVFCDIDKDTWNINLDGVEGNAFEYGFQAICAVHTFGNPCNCDQLKYLKDLGYIVVEDCAEAMGATYNGKKVGTFGNAAAFSFNATKNMTTGEGGAVLFEDEGDTKIALLLKENGFGYKTRNAQLAGHNYRLSNIQCAIGIEQLKTLDKRNEKRREIARIFDNCIESNTHQYKLTQDWNGPGQGKSVYQIYGFLVPDYKNRDEVLNYLLKEGIECKKYFDPPIHRQTFYNIKNNMKLPITEETASRIICLPLDDELTKKDINYICDKLGVLCYP